MGELEQVRKNIDERYNAEMRDCIARFNEKLEQDKNGRYIISARQLERLLKQKLSILGNYQGRFSGKSSYIYPLVFDDYKFESSDFLGERNTIIAKYDDIPLKFANGISTSRDITLNNCHFHTLDTMYLSSKIHGLSNKNLNGIRLHGCLLSNLKLFSPFAFVSIDNCKITNLTFNHFPSDEHFRFTAKQCCILSIRDHTRKDRIVNLSFEQCMLGKEDEISSGQLGSLYFQNSEFNDSLHFTNCDFYTHPNFHNSKLHQDTLFHECIFHDTQSAGAEAAYRTLKQHMEGLHNENMMHEFHALELQSRRHRLTEGKKWWQWIRGKDGIEIMGTNMMEGISNFGQNLWLPAWWLFIFLPLVFFSVYCGLHLVACGSDLLLERSSSWVSKTCASDVTSVTLPMLHSFTNTLGPLSLIFKTDAIGASGFVGKFIGMVQFVISSLIWFLWVVQIRRRFKM